MSKKSRKRNKKILGALAAGLGAMALMKRKKAASVASSDDAGIGVTHPALSAINKASNVASNVNDSRFDTRFSKPTEETMSKGLRSRVLQAKANAPKNVMGPFSYMQSRTPPGGMRGMHKSGGRVTGAAKRGFGRALMKGKK